MTTHLALLRVAVAAMVLLDPAPGIALEIASRPRAAWTIPEGLGWLVAIAPPTVDRITVVTAVMRVAAALALVGLFTRPALAVLCVSGLYVLGAAQLTGTVTHDMHLSWMTALLAVTPSGAVLSADRQIANLRGRALIADEGRAAWGLAAARLWLGLVYFFPGVHKLTGAGLAWVTGDTVRNQLHFKWYEAGAVPWPRLDHAPSLLHAGAAAVVALELAMPALLLWRRTRMIALVGGCAFHLLTSHFFFIHFWSLAVCFVLALPLREPESRPPLRTAGVALLAVMAVVTAGVVTAGVRGQTQGYPFACYPTFAHLAPDEIPDLAVEVTGPDGQVSTHRLPRLRRQDQWGMVWRVAGLYGDPVEPARLRAFAETIVPAETRAKAVSTRWVLERYAVRPEDWGAPPRSRGVVLVHP